MKGFDFRTFNQHYGPALVVVGFVRADLRWLIALGLIQAIIGHVEWDES